MTAEVIEPQQETGIFAQVRGRGAGRLFERNRIGILSAGARLSPGGGRSERHRDIHSGTIYQLIGKREEAKNHHLLALQIATDNQRMSRIIECETRLGNAWILHSDHPQAIERLEKAHAHAVQINDMAGICDALIVWALINGVWQILITPQNICNRDWRLRANLRG